MLSEIQAGRFWVDDLGDDIEFALVIPPGHWTIDNVHWIIWITGHSLDHSVVKLSCFPNSDPLE